MPKPLVLPFRRRYWLLLPLLAIIAYATVVRIGFLADDLLLLGAAKQGLLDLRVLLPQDNSYLYRPVGQLLTWSLGWQVWGFNPAPFHIQGLLLHAGVSLVLGLWIGGITYKPVIGWLAGALFAVFPLHLEAVGWLAAQWDVLATLFGLLSAWIFAVWWKSRSGTRWYLLAASILCYAVGIFSKESLLTFVPLIGISAWIARPPETRRSWLTLGAALVPFGIVAAAYTGLRFAAWGTMGTYANLRTDYPSFFWTAFLGHLNVLLAPINPKVFNAATAQVVGALCASLFIVGLVLYGRGTARLLAFVGAWLVLTLAPVLNLGVVPGDLQQNRFLYLPAVGYCVGAATLLYSMWSSFKSRRARAASMALIGCTLLLSIFACWMQLRPWHTTTVMAQEIDAQTRRLIPPLYNRPSGMAWYVESPPDNYKGAYLFRLGMGAMRDFTSGDGVWVENTGNALAAPVDVAAKSQDAFTIRFAYDESITGFRADYVAGITQEAALPTGNQVGSSLLLWDFTGCSPDVLKAWYATGAKYECIPGTGLMLRPDHGDPQFVGPDITVDVPPRATGFIRVRVAASYPANNKPAPIVGQLYWTSKGEAMREEHSRSHAAVQDGHEHVYWTFLSSQDVGSGISKLRFDPANDTIPVLIKWIAVDTVE